MATTASAVTDFSQPVYLDDDTSQLSGVSAEQTNYDDPSLLSEEIDSNAAVDAYAAPPPLPDAQYRVKLKQIDVKRPDGTTGRFAVKKDPQKNKGVAYAWTALEMTVIDPSGAFDGFKLWDRFVSTMQQRNGGIPIVRIITCLGGKLPDKVNAQVLMETFFKLVAGEPELMVDTVWEGQVGEDDRERFKTAQVKEPRLLGMHKFPVKVGEDGKEIAGQYSPSKEVDTPLGKVFVEARPRVNGYFPIKK